MSSKPVSLSILKRVGKLASDGYLICDIQDKRVLYANQAVATILHIPEADGYSMNDVRSRIREEDAFLHNCIERLVNKRKLENVELRVEGSDRFISVTAFLLKRENLVIVHIKDITSAKQFVNYLSEFGARKNALLDMVANNLAGPLNVTNKLLDVIDHMNDSHNNRLLDGPTRLIRENTQQCIETINSFMVAEHSASQNVVVKAVRFDAIAKIKVVIDSIKTFHADKDFVVRSAFSELFVSMDDVKFFQVIHNLLSNAVKFTRSNGRIIVEAKADDRYLTLSVTDDGIGIPEYLQPYIFIKNTLAGRPGLKGEKSVGMGLYLVNKLLKLMDGEIEFSSAEGHGSTFIITLPRIKTDDEEAN